MNCICKQNADEDIIYSCLAHASYAGAVTAKEIYKLAGVVMARSVGLPPGKVGAFQEAAEILTDHAKELRELSGVEKLPPEPTKG